MKLRNYRKEYDEYHGSADQRRNRSGRNKARRLMVMAGRARKGDGKEVDHKRPVKRGGSLTGRGNLQVMSRKANREKGSR